MVTLSAFGLGARMATSAECRFASDESRLAQRTLCLVEMLEEKILGHLAAVGGRSAHIRQRRIVAIEGRQRLGDRGECPGATGKGRLHAWRAFGRRRHAAVTDARLAHPSMRNVDVETAAHRRDVLIEALA